MTQPRAELAQSARPRTLLTLVAGAGGYAVTPGDLAAAVSASVVDISVTSGHRRGRGTGVIFDTAGHILTRYCVVAATGLGSTIIVTLKDKRTFEAMVVDTDPTTDLAFIKLTNAPKDLKAIALEDAKAFTIGHPAAS